jgi:hAT family C-terminal dimerisation region
LKFQAIKDEVLIKIIEVTAWLHVWRGEAHGLACLLDPRLIDEGLSRADRKATEDTQNATPLGNNKISSEESAFQVSEEFTQFVIVATRQKRSPFEDTYKQAQIAFGVLASGWPNMAGTSVVAGMVFSIATSSAASARYFSVMGNVNTKIWNRLSGTSVEKLFYIKSNTNAFQRNSVTPEDACDSYEDSFMDDEDNFVVCINSS